ncbi:MAG: hypothetical protein ACO33A_05710 [Hyphomonas sp.]
MKSVLGRAAELLPADWSQEAKLAVIGGGALLAVLLLGLLLLALSGRKRAPDVRNAGAGLLKTAPEPRPAPSAGPDLNPEEWVWGNVIHYDRQRAFGYIRCDRVKGHVRFQADGFDRAPRVGEKVRFKGRHGAMRKPVAVVVERAG